MKGFSLPFTEKNFINVNRGVEGFNVTLKKAFLEHLLKVRENRQVSVIRDLWTDDCLA